MRRSLIVDNLANESIAFQTTSVFFKDLCLNLTALKKLTKTEIPDAAAILSDVVKHHTGLNVTFNIDDAQPQVTIPMVNKNNILINSFIRDYLNSSDGIKLIKEAKDVARGNVNIKTGMVSGVFTEVKSTIDLPLLMFVNSTFTVEEIAAITLHEVGHLFVYYEYMARTVTTNQVLSGVAKGLDQSNSIEERELVLVTAKKTLDLNNLDTKLLAKSTNKKISEIVLITNITKKVVSELDSNIYDFSTWEYLADQYAARQGAGRHLVTGLDKIYKGSWHISFRSTPSYLAFEAIKAILIISPILLAAVAQVVVTFPLMLGITLLLGDSDNTTYDRPGERYKRVRDQIVENLKNKKLPNEDKIRLEEDLVVIDALLREVNDRRQWFGAVYDIISPSANKSLNQERLQQDLEALIANDLFVKAAMLQKAA